MTFRKITATILTAILLLCSLSVCASAESGKAGDNITWEYDADTSTLTFSGSGRMYDFKMTEDTPWDNIEDPWKVNIIFEDGITYIGKYAFYDFWNKNFTIPKSVKDIAISAFILVNNDVVAYAGTESEWQDIFSGSYDKAEMHFSTASADDIPESVAPEKGGANITYEYDDDTNTLYINGSGDMYDFKQGYTPWDDTEPYTVIIEDGITSIGDNAFMGFFFISNVIIPESVTYISEDAFSIFTDNDVICFGGSESQWDKATNGWFIYDDATVYYNTTSFDDMPLATSAGKNLDWEYDEDSSTLTISGEGKMSDFRPGKAPWADKTVLYVEIGEGVTDLGDNSFTNQPKLKRIILPESLESIGLDSFPESFAFPPEVIYYGDKKSWDNMLVSFLLEDADAEIIFTSDIAVKKPGVDLEYKYDEVSKTLTISGKGRVFDYDEVTPPWDGKNIKNVVFEEGVTYIGSNLLDDYDILTCAIPESVKSSASGAFDFLSTNSVVYYAGSLSSLGLFNFNGATAWANAEPPKKNYNPGDKITVVVDGGEVAFDAEPFIEDGRTLVPVRAIFEAMDAEVVWDATDRTVYSRREYKYISLTIDSKTMTKRVGNGKNEKITLDVPAKIHKDRTYVPVRAIAESFNADVQWEAETRTVYVKTNDAKIEYAARQLVAQNYNFMPNSVYFNVSEHSKPYDISISNGKVFYSLARSTSVFVYDGVTSTEYDLGGIIYNMLASGNKLYYIDSSQCVCVLDISTGIAKELFKLPLKIKRESLIEPGDVTAAMKLYNGILSVTIEQEVNDRKVYYTYNIDVKNGKVGMKVGAFPYTSGREYYTNKLYADDGKTILASGTVHFCAKDANKTVYIKFDGKDQNLSEWEIAFKQGMGFSYYANMSLYVVNNDGTDNTLIAKISSGSSRPSTSGSTSSGGANIEPERPCGLCNGRGRITCTFCDGSGKVEEYDTLNHKKVTRTCPAAGCYGGEKDCPGC